MQHPKQELLNLCRRAWIMDLLRKTKQDIETVKKYENLFQVKKMKHICYSETVLYGRNVESRLLFMIGCKLQEKSKKSDFFEVYIIPSKTPDSYYLVRDITLPGENKPVHVLLSLVENVTFPEGTSCIAKLCC